MNTAFEFANENLKTAAMVQKRNYEVKLKERDYAVGNWVWRWYPPSANQKLGLGWTGPYLIVKKFSPLTYGIQKNAKARVLNVHADHLKPYVGNVAPNSWLDDFDENSIMQNYSRTEAENVEDGEPNFEMTYESLGQQFNVAQSDAIEPDSCNTPKQCKYRVTRTGRVIKPRDIYSP